MTGVILALVGVAALGCGSDVASSTTAGGSSSGVPLPPQGAFQVTFGAPAGCSIAGHNAKVGDVNETQRNAVVVDGTDGATVSCAVTGAGPYSVAGQITMAADNSLQIEVDSLPADATKTNPAKGRVAFTSPNTAKAYIADAMHVCDFYFAAGSKESVAAGKVWVAFACPSITAEGMDTCALFESYVVLENCTH